MRTVDYIFLSVLGFKIVLVAISLRYSLRNSSNWYIWRLGFPLSHRDHKNVAIIRSHDLTWGHHVTGHMFLTWHNLNWSGSEIVFDIPNGIEKDWSEIKVKKENSILSMLFSHVIDPVMNLQRIYVILNWQMSNEYLLPLPFRHSIGFFFMHAFLFCQWNPKSF